MKLSKYAIKLCAGYAIFMAVLFIFASHADVKGRLLLASIAYLPTGLLFALLGWFPMVEANPWMNGPLFLAPVTLLLVYFIGCAVSAISARAKRRTQEAVAATLRTDGETWHSEK